MPGRTSGRDYKAIRQRILAGHVEDLDISGFEFFEFADDELQELVGREIVAKGLIVQKSAAPFT